MFLGEWINNVLAGKTLYRVIRKDAIYVSHTYYVQKWTWCFPIWITVDGWFRSKETAEENIRGRLHYFEWLE